MDKRTQLGIVSIYAASHALVDAASAATLFAVAASGRYEPGDVFLFVVLYNVLAFATQPVFGLLADALDAPAYAAVLGMALVAAATLLVPFPLAAAIAAGVG